MLLTLAVAAPTSARPTRRPDAGASDAGARAGARDAGAPARGACSIAGRWSGAIPAGPFGGQTNAWTLAPGGTWSAVMGPATVSGTWSLTGSTLVVTDTASNPTYVACPASDRGTYEIAFSADCRTMTLHATSEPCEGRRLALDGFAPRR